MLSSFLASMFKTKNKTSLKNEELVKKYSSYLYDHYENWSEEMNSKRKDWYLGVNHDSSQSFYKNSMGSVLFCGAFGSGKTESIKTWLSAAIIQKNAISLICDLKGTSDYNVFLPVTSDNKIFTTQEEALDAISKVYNLYLSREEKNDKKIDKDQQPVILVIDEFSQIINSLDIYKNYYTFGTKAYELMTLLEKGKNREIYLALGVMSPERDYLPSLVLENIETKVVFRQAFSIFSIDLIKSNKAFQIGENSFYPDGSKDRQSGYAYIDNDTNLVKFYFMSDFMIRHEMLKYQVPINNCSAINFLSLSNPLMNRNDFPLPGYAISQKLKKNESLTDYLSLVYENYKVKKEKMIESYAKIYNSYVVKELVNIFDEEIIVDSLNDFFNNKSSEKYYQVLENF